MHVCMHMQETGGETDEDEKEGGEEEKKEKKCRSCIHSAGHAVLGRAISLS